MAKVTNYQCPACTGPLHFVGASGKLECDYCGSSFSVEEIDKLYNDKVADAKEEAEKEQQKEAEKIDVEGENATGAQWDQQQVHMYNCSSCGAEIICDTNTVATSCPYCGNPTVIPGQFTAGEMPEKVIPFKYDKKAAIESLKNFYKGKKFLPTVFSRENHIEEIKGIYVPFWLFDGEAYADVSMHGTRSHSHRQGDYEVTDTDHYTIRRSGKVPFEGIPADGSAKMDNALMDSIEPFEYSELTDFSTSYLPGFYAESYDEDSNKVLPRIVTRVDNTASSIMYNDVHGYDTVTITSSKVDITKYKAHYVFLPVWLLNTKWNDKNFQFAMNGQTGKFVGNLPVDKGKFAKWLIGLTIGIAPVVFGIAYLVLKYMVN